MLVEVAMQHNDSYTENIYSFVNNINTPEGGTHLTGFKNALTKTLNDYARKNKLLKDNEPVLSGEDIREGLTAIISVKIGEPQFEGQTKQKLGNSEARGAVDSIVSETADLFPGAESVRRQDHLREIHSGTARAGRGQKGQGSDQEKDCPRGNGASRQACRLF